MVVTSAFAASLVLVKASGMIPLKENLDWTPYFAGILVASIWIHHRLVAVGDRLGALDAREAARLTARLAVVLSTLAFATKDVGVSRVFLVGFLALAAGVLFFAHLVFAPMLAAAFFRGRSQRTVIVAPRTEARLLLAWLATSVLTG